MNRDPIAPWGTYPTPLLPRWYRETFAERSLPRSITRSNPQLSTIADLERFWEHEQRPDSLTLPMLADVVDRRIPPLDMIVVRPGIDCASLARLPCRRQTMNTLHRGGLFERRDGIRVGDLVSLAYVGIVSLLEFMCVTELLLLDIPEDAPRAAGAGRGRRPDNPGRGHEDASHPHGLWSEVTVPLTSLLAVAREFHGARTVGDALNLDLGKLADILGVKSAMDAIEIDDLTDGHRLSHTVMTRIAAVLSERPPREHAIIDRYLHPGDARRVTLAQLGAEFGISRERVRQIKFRIERLLEARVGTEIGAMAIIIGGQLGPIVAADRLERALSTALPTGSHAPKAVRLARLILKSRLSYSCENGICLNATALDVVHDMKSAARESADTVGLIDRDALEEQLPGDAWRDGFAQLANRAGLQWIGDELALRATKKAIIKAAIIGIGRPATKLEIAQASGLDAKRLGTLLSKIDGVGRADLTRWGLSEWIDDEYEGIAPEIIQRIDEDGGETTVCRLVEELPRLFGVSRTSVRTILATPRFTVEGGRVSLADESDIVLRHLRDVAHGWTSDGSPYWTFRAKKQYFAGYSLLGFPPEFAASLGCPPDDGIRVNVARPAGGYKLSVRWNLHAPTGPSLGYLARPLRELGAITGDRIQVIVKGPEVCELQMHSPPDE